MKVIFLKAVPPHKVGDIAEVAVGHAQNFLFPRALAKQATPEAIASIQKQAAIAAAHSVEATQKLARVLQKLANSIMTIPARKSATGTLYAALTPKAIAQAIQTHIGSELPAELGLQLPHIKHAGEYAVTLHHDGQTATFTLKV